VGSGGHGGIEAVLYYSVTVPIWPWLSMINNYKDTNSDYVTRKIIDKWIDPKSWEALGSEVEVVYPIPLPPD
jgi:hypothetical protein